MSISPGATISTVVLGGVKSYEPLHPDMEIGPLHASGGKSTV
jgi:hypothetical protein